jgi:uncharacterized protein YbaR (Trm112 family)
MLDPELLALLVCPQTHQDVTLATPEEIARLNEAIRLGHVTTTGHKEVIQPLEAALIRIDRAIAYPIKEGIPVMLVDEGLMIAEVDLVGKVKA